MIDRSLSHAHAYPKPRTNITLDQDAREKRDQVIFEFYLLFMPPSCLVCGKDADLILHPCGHRPLCGNCVHLVPVPLPWPCPLCQRTVTSMSFHQQGSTTRPPLDQNENSSSSSTIPPVKTKTTITSSSLTPTCVHGLEAVQLTCKNGGPNHGRMFWRCPHWREQDRMCDFFRWVEEHHVDHHPSRVTIAVPVDPFPSAVSPSSSKTNSIPKDGR